MKEANWFHPRLGRDHQNFQWDPVSGGTIWQVKIQKKDAPPPLPVTQNQPPPAVTNRNEYDLATHCLFGDFYLTLQFRLPNVRADWNFNQGSHGNKSLGPREPPCNSPIYGISNWANSGVKAMGKLGLYEVQILDSYNANSVPPGSTAVPTDGSLMNLGGDCKINPIEICGAIYKKTPPSSNVVKAAANAGTDYPRIPGGDWNTLEIYFMSARFAKDATKTKVRCTTITVTLNGTTVQDRQGIAGVTSGTESESGIVNNDHRYNQNWLQGVGAILLQEHDSKIQFRSIQVNSGWYPKTSGGSFNSNWQRTWDSVNKKCM